MPSDDVNQWTRREWRELGFFYDRNDETKVWRLIGSRSGLLRFRDALLAFADDPGNDYESEHEHYGPYSYATRGSCVTIGWPHSDKTTSRDLALEYSGKTVLELVRNRRNRYLVKT